MSWRCGAARRRPPGRARSKLRRVAQATIDDLLKRHNDILESNAAASEGGGAGFSAEACEQRIAEAHRSIDASRQKFNQLRTVCVNAEQGLKSVLERSQVCLKEKLPEELVPVSTIPTGAPPKVVRRTERRGRCRATRRSSRAPAPPRACSCHTFHRCVALQTGRCVSVLTRVCSDSVGLGVQHGSQNGGRRQP